MSKLNRRAAMTATLAGVFMGASAAHAQGIQEIKLPTIPNDSLAGLAKARGLKGFGSCMGGAGRPGGMFEDAGARAIQIHECNIFVHENDLKWTVVRPSAAVFEFAPADRLLDWAEKHNMMVRGHNLMWLRPDRNPEWLNNYNFGARPATEAERLIREHVTTVCNRYGTRIFAWDVVNEAIDPATGGMRDMVFSKYLGNNAMSIVFDAARKAAPNATLVYNDFMTWGENSARHRDGVLKLLSWMKEAKLPVQALGVQSHIGAGEIGGVRGTMSFDAREEREWKSFVDAAVAMGFGLQITEFDVSETGTPADPGERDKIIADLTQRYMSMMLGYKQLDQIIAWGLLDQHSWLQSRTRRADGMLKRPTFYDANYRAKPMRAALAAAFKGR